MYDHCTLRSSERVVPTSSAPLLTNQHENADVSFIDLRSYLPEISGVRPSKLPPLLRGGDKIKSYWMKSFGGCYGITTNRRLRKRWRTRGGLTSCSFYHVILRVHALRSYLKPIFEHELHRLPNKKVSGAKDHGKNYIKVRPPLVRHLLRNHLLQILTNFKTNSNSCSSNNAK